MAYSNSGSYTTGNSTKSEAQVCLKFPPKVSSPGLMALWSAKGQNKGKLRMLMEYSGPRLQIQMVVTFVLTQAIHSVLKHLRLPMFISQILAGMILGPMVFRGKRSLITSSDQSVAVLGTVGAIGYMFFLFLSGVKMDVGMTFRSGKKVICIGVLTVVVPLMACLITAKSLNQESQFFTNKRVFLAVTYSATSFPVIHCLLSELKLLNSELGRLGLSAALIGEIVALFLLTICQWVVDGLENGWKVVVSNFGFFTVYFVIVVFWFRPVMKWMVRKTPEGGQIKNSYLYIVIGAFLVSHKLAELLKVYIVFAPFLVGLAVPDGPPLGSALVEKLEPIVEGLFMPLFVTTCGMRIDFSYLKNYGSFAKDQVISAVVTNFVKFGVSFLLPFLWNIPIRDSLAFAFIMLNKGIVEMASYSFMNDTLVISQDMFAFVTIIVILIASIVPIFVKTLYDPSSKHVRYLKKSIMDCKLNDELRIIGCIHVPANVNSIIDILNASCPTRQSPIALSVLHLIKLSGRATPLFIAHEKQSKSPSNNSYSENVVLAFNRLERDNWGAVSVKSFTAVSPPNLMHEDICNLVMDQFTSFLILPFHRRRHVDGSIESEDQTVRRLNFNILQKPPCSVGILVEGQRHVKCINSRDHMHDQYPLANSSTYTIAMIFMGGKDDWEALALAKRMSRDKSVKLTVIQFKAVDGFQDDDGDRMMDKQLLRNVKENTSTTYIEKEVKDGPETLTYLRSIVDDYKLFIVGRRYKREDPQTVGLHEWSEFQDISIIGELLSSPDFGGKHSVLIVRHQ
ncbi:hypothetical protein ES319_D05G008400v1 [Gossypium barbadense]|uniref:Uncharacterized protein n=1 Tax=Gossypium barbadense TaxID=3634 RepID=A0A5J5R801_GOSBA|nr:hypothetical protein ES319_D05G008400v1 [Gossypium barbadense]PPD74685.1 hypothetical protein GOBAR_DD28378 [Gossypium barbadense]